MQSKQLDLQNANSAIASADKAKASIKDLQKQQDSLQKKVNSSEAKLKSLNGQIDTIKIKPIQLPAGNFVVGKNFPAGRYIISGTSNFIVNEGDSINTILGSTGSGDYHGDLSDGDTVENDAPATLTPAD